MPRVFNFSAGPATLPIEVLEKAQNEMTDFRGAGMSVMEMSHRSPEYLAIFEGAKDNLRKLMSVPEEYEILFLHGGASSQFAMVPLNFMSKNGKADYVNTGLRRRLLRPNVLVKLTSWRLLKTRHSATSRS